MRVYPYNLKIMGMQSSLVKLINILARWASSMAVSEIEYLRLERNREEYYQMSSG